MHAAKIVAALGLSAMASAAPLEARDDAGSILADLQAQAMANLREAEANGTLSKRNGGCNLLNAQVRRDWYVSRPR